MRKKIILLLALALIASLTAGVWFSRKLSSKANSQCAVKIEYSQVSGQSLEPTIKNGAKIKIDVNYYKCHEAKIGDIVVYQYAQNAAPIIKVVRALPGDNVSLKKSLVNPQEWQILVNNSILKNSQGKEYAINKAKADLLNLYVKDYQGKLPPDSYLIMGNEIAGSFDSTRMGFVGKDGFLGKVVR